MKISVITAVYNNRSTIQDCLESVLSQSYSDVEFIVIDGDSTDGTKDILSSYATRLDVLISEPDCGIYDALNKGIRLSSGDVVGFLHSDDLFANTNVLNRVAMEFANSQIDAVFGDLFYVNRAVPGRIVRTWRAGKFTHAKLKWGWMPPHPTFYLRKELYDQNGGFDTSYGISADYDFMLRLLVQPSFRIEYITETMVLMRTGGVSNRSFWNLICKTAEDYRVLRTNSVGGLGALVLKNLTKVPQFFVK